MSETAFKNALALRRAGRFAEAAAIYGEILREQPAHFEALHALGILRYQSGNLQDAERLVAQAARVNPRSADAAYNHACLLQRLNRPEEALAAFDSALAVRPDYLEALVNRGAVLWTLQRHEDALANSQRVVELKPDFAEGRKNRAAVLTFLQRYDEALREIDRALHLAPDDSACLARRADLLALLNRTGEAVSAYENYLILKPEDAEAWHARGYALKLLNRAPEALACFEKAVTLAPGNLAMRESRGSMLFTLQLFEEAAGDYEMLSAGEAPPSWVPGYMAVCHVHCCEWRSLEAERTKISAEIAAGRFIIDPTGNMVISHSLEEQLRCARIWAEKNYPAPATKLWNGEIYRHDKIRLAYLSADFRTHATAFLMAGIFEHHDKNRFETIAISYSEDDKSPMRTRLQNSFGRFIDVQNRTDSEVAALMREMEVDVAVDLKGYTAQSRPGILSHRAVPVQAHYLGFPGTMGLDYVDYLIADAIVIPGEHLPYYTEKIAYLPDSYQCNDTKRRMAGRTPSRAEAGLPSGFVFCCFNNNQKIVPEMFDIWMRLLGAVQGSVLWLLQDNVAAARNLCREAAARGIAPERLVFALRAEPGVHLARQSLADLFLDTLPYNAHTTASDALWVGLPVVTCAGSTFAGRVAASLLHAADLPELVTHSLGEYEALALKLAHDPAALAAIKTKLRMAREKCALFDTARMTRSLEAAYIQMWERSQQGLPPATFGANDPPSS